MCLNKIRHKNMCRNPADPENMDDLWPDTTKYIYNIKFRIYLKVKNWYNSLKYY